MQFRTRHNDYLLKMPHRTNGIYHATEDIPFPAVPPSVLSQPTVRAQVAEMRQYFRAFKLQDPLLRDYRPYFRATLCYLEGAWTLVGRQLEEPFLSERHSVDAATWLEQEQKARFVAYTGTTYPGQNMVFLPQAIVHVDDSDDSGTGTVLAQWNYRIMCHPLAKDLPTDSLRVLDDHLASRVATGTSMDEYTKSRHARFSVSSPSNNGSDEHGYITTTQSSSDLNKLVPLLDQLMQQVPGVDNYMGSLSDQAFGQQAYEPYSASVLNAAYYHRCFRYGKPEEFGKIKNLRYRGFSDRTFYAAMTSQSHVWGAPLNNCVNEWKEHPHCHNYSQKWTYAIPMEIVYMTPLTAWNPYGIDYHGWAADDNSATAGGSRDGSEKRPFNGTNSRHFYRTPAELFSQSDEHKSNPADSTGEAFYVLDATGTSHKVRASGHRTYLPDMGDGVVRQRYPIWPVHGEHSGALQQMAALRDIVLRGSETFANIRYDTPASGPDPTPAPGHPICLLAPAAAEYDFHTHSVQLTPDDIHLLTKGGGVLRKSTSLAYGHRHQVSLIAVSVAYNHGYRLHIVTCDDGPVCKGEHGLWIQGAFTLDWQLVDHADLLYDSFQEQKGQSHGGGASGSASITGVLWLVVISCVVRG